MKTEIFTLSEKIQSCLEKKSPFVIYRKCNKEDVIAIVQKNKKLYTTKNFEESGFIMAPFDRDSDIIFFPITKSEKTLLKYPKKKSVKKDNLSVISKESYKHTHIALVKKTIAFIQDGKADKVVISRKIESTYKSNRVGLIYEYLLHEYPKAMVYIWYHPKVGLWMGATPEKMLFVHKDSFRTMALAGTQLKSDKIVWNQKEQEEQRWVTDFITDQLIPISHHLEISKPYTDYAGHLVHIRTDIKGFLADAIRLKDLIYKIHPTPAVCGVPRYSAQDFIENNEGYKRDFYTGFLGEINLDEQTDLYVNLRCMCLNKTHAILYVGGGITKDSVPEKEWIETLQKSNILAKFLR